MRGEAASEMRGKGAILFVPLRPPASRCYPPGPLRLAHTQIWEPVPLISLVCFMWFLAHPGVGPIGCD